MEYEKIIKDLISEDNLIIKLISNTNNKVYKVTTKSENLFVKFYEGISTHIDNELKLYDLIDSKFLKELVYKSESPKIAIYKELIGTTIDEFSEKELECKCEYVIENVIEYYTKISSHKVKGYGILDENLNGIYDDFFIFLKERQSSSAEILKDYPELKDLFDMIIKKYKDIIIVDNRLVPIDTNLKNIMILENGAIKFVDSGEMISGPLLMGYGDFVAHTYNTVLYEPLMKKLSLNDNEKKLVRIYAIFSSLNILAFLKKNGVNELDKVIPYGNKYTFYQLIEEHLKYLDLK